MTSAIEQRAERVLAGVPDWIWDGDRLPVPVEHIADSHFGLHVRDVEDMRRAPGVPAGLPAGKGLSGLLLPSLGEIWVNAAEARDWPARRRFTIGHELGHWSLHRTGGAVWCRSHTVDPDPDRPPVEAEPAPRQAYPPEESEANEFAAALLMPAHLVKRHYERLRRRDPDGCFGQMCRIFDTSGAAMGRRLNRVV
jgi:IrrE N-terminal-like domain